jgi:hypothetical protein
MTEAINQGVDMSRRGHDLVTVDGVTVEIKQTGNPRVSLGVPSKVDGMTGKPLLGRCALFGTPTLAALCDLLLSICSKACDSALPSCPLIPQRAVAHSFKTLALTQRWLPVYSGLVARHWGTLTGFKFEDPWIDKHVVCRRENRCSKGY